MPPLTDTRCWKTKICSSKNTFQKQLSIFIRVLAPEQAILCLYLFVSPRQQNEDSQETLCEWGSSSPKTEACKTRKKVISHPLPGVLRKSYGLEGEKQFISTPSRWASSPHSYMPSRKRLTTSKSKLARCKWSNLKIRSPDPIEIRILHVILDGDTLSPWLMRRNSPFTINSATLNSNSLKESMSIISSSSSLFFFLPPFDEKKREWQGDAARKEVRVSKQWFLKMEKMIFSHRILSIYR